MKVWLPSVVSRQELPGRATLQRNGRNCMTQIEFGSPNGLASVVSCLCRAIEPYELVRACFWDIQEMLPNLRFDCSILNESLQAHISTNSLDSGFTSNSDEQVHKQYRNGRRWNRLQ